MNWDITEACQYVTSTPTGAKERDYFLIGLVVGTQYGVNYRGMLDEKIEHPETETIFPYKGTPYRTDKKGRMSDMGNDGTMNREICEAHLETVKTAIDRAVTEMKAVVAEVSGDVKELRARDKAREKEFDTMICELREDRKARREDSIRIENKIEDLKKDFRTTENYIRTNTYVIVIGIASMILATIGLVSQIVK